MKIIGFCIDAVILFQNKVWVLLILDTCKVHLQQWYESKYKINSIPWTSHTLIPNMKVSTISELKHGDPVANSDNGWRLNCRHFPDDILKSIFLMNCCTLIKFSLKFVSNGPVYNEPVFVEILTSCLLGTIPLFESKRRVIFRWSFVYGSS